MTNNFTETGYNNPSLVVESAKCRDRCVSSRWKIRSKNSAGSPVGHAPYGIDGN